MNSPSLSAGLDHPIALGDFAESVTPETRELLLQRLATESHSDSYQTAIPGMASETLNVPVDDLIRDFRQYKKSNDSSLPSLADAVISEGDFLILEITPRLLILFPWLRKGDLVMITAPRGIGKSWFLHVLMTAITRGLLIGSWQTETPVNCLLVDGEMAGEDLQKRFKRLTKNLPKPEKRLDFLSADLMHQMGFSTPNLTSAEWRESLYKLLASSDYGLIVIDNMAALSPPGWPLESPPSVAGSKSPSDRVLNATLFSETRQSYFLLHPSFSPFSVLWESRPAASLSR